MQSTTKYNHKDCLKYRRILDSYISEAAFSEGNLGKELSKGIFLNAANDFLAGTLNTNYFSSICHALHFELNNISDIVTKWERLGSLLESCSELDFYKNKAEKGDKDAKTIFQNTINDLRKFTIQNLGQ